MLPSAAQCCPVLPGAGQCCPVLPSAAHFRAHATATASLRPYAGRSSNRLLLLLSGPTAPRGEVPTCGSVRGTDRAGSCLPLLFPVSRSAGQPSSDGPGHAGPGGARRGGAGRREASSYKAQARCRFHSHYNDRWACSRRCTMRSALAHSANSRLSCVRCCCCCCLFNLH